MGKFKEFLLENPDRVSTNIWHGKRDARAFGYINNRFFVSNQPINHGVFVEKLLNSNKISLKDLGVKDPNDIQIGRHNFRFAGRLWLDHKIISFWEFPNKSEFSKIVSELNKNGIKVDDTWKIDTDTKEDRNFDISTDNTKLIKASDYTDKMKSIKVKEVEHTLDPQIKGQVLKSRGLVPKYVELSKKLPKDFSIAKYNFLKGESLQ